MKRQTKRYEGGFYFDTILYTTLSMNNHNTNLRGLNYKIYNRFTQTIFRYRLRYHQSKSGFVLVFGFIPVSIDQTGLKYRMLS